MTPSAFTKWGPRVEKALEAVLPTAEEGSATLHGAMRYSVMAGGKRIRPILALCAYEACGGSDAEKVLPAAAALELFHTYSLVHDDLPAMDDDDLRRGKPTNHKVYGEAAAILAGDALQTLAAELLAVHPKGAEYLSRRGRASRVVFRALGSRGMAGGQMFDLEGSAATDLPGLVRIHRLKTGVFLEACLKAGAIWAGAPVQAVKALERYGAAIGMAFQVVDDLLDVTASAEALGKTPGKDLHQGKATFPSLLGMEESRKRADRLLSEALRALSPLGDGCQDLRELAHFVVNRDR